ELYAKHKFDVGTIRGEECTIELSDRVPVALRPYRASPIECATMAEQIEHLLKHNLIAESNSPYAAPVVLAYKKDEHAKCRFCCDFRALNAITKTEGYPFPLIEELVDQVHDCKYFSTIDVASGFHHIQVSTADRHK